MVHSDDAGTQIAAAVLIALLVAARCHATNGQEQDFVEATVVVALAFILLYGIMVFVTFSCAEDPEFWVPFWGCATIVLAIRMPPPR